MMMMMMIQYNISIIFFLIFSKTEDQKKKQTKYSLPTNLIPFALAECNRYLQSIIHEDIDAPVCKIIHENLTIC